MIHKRFVNCARRSLSIRWKRVIHNSTTNCSVRSIHMVWRAVGLAMHWIRASKYHTICHINNSLCIFPKPLDVQSLESFARRTMWFNQRIQMHMQLKLKFMLSYRSPRRYTFEVGPVFTLMENEMIQTFCTLFGFANGDGIFAPGGSISNM